MQGSDVTSTTIQQSGLEATTISRYVKVRQTGTIIMPIQMLLSQKVLAKVLSR